MKRFRVLGLCRVWWNILFNILWSYCSLSSTRDAVRTAPPPAPLAINKHLDTWENYDMWQYLITVQTVSMIFWGPTLRPHGFLPNKHDALTFHHVLKCPFFAEQRMSLLGKRIFTHPSIFTFYHVMNASGNNLLKLYKLIQIIVKNVNR